MHWLWAALVTTLGVVAQAQTITTSNATIYTAYLRVRWPNASLATVEANENALKAGIARTVLAATTTNATNATSTLFLNATVLGLEIRTLTGASVTLNQTQNWTIEYAIQAASTSANASPASIVNQLVSLTVTPTLNTTLQASLTVAAGLSFDASTTPSVSRLQVAPTPATLDGFADGSATYTLVNLHFFAPNSTTIGTTFTGNYFSLAALTRMRYAVYALLGFKNDGYEDAYIMQVTNTTLTPNKPETDVLVFVRLNSSLHTLSAALQALASGSPSGTTTLFLADYMAQYNFTARNYSMVVESPWTAPSSTWWVSTTTATSSNASISGSNSNGQFPPITTPAPPGGNLVGPATSPPFPTGPLPTTVVPLLDGGLVQYPFTWSFNVTAANVAPVYLVPGICNGWNQVCLHLKWVVETNDSYVLARVKGQQYINSTLYGNTYGPAINANQSSIWTLYDVPPTDVMLDFIRTSDQALATIDITAALLSSTSATSTVSSTTNSDVYTTYYATPLSAKELVLEIHVKRGTPPTPPTMSLQNAGCAYCNKLASQCTNDVNCTGLSNCLVATTSASDQYNLLVNGDYGDSLNTTLATQRCFVGVGNSPGRALFDQVANCLITRACPYGAYADLAKQGGPSKLIWQAPTPAWIQLQLTPWNQLPAYVTTLQFTLNYANNPGCPVTLFSGAPPTNFSAQLSACVLGDCEVVVLSNTTNVTTLDIVFNNHIGPTPVLSYSPQAATFPIPTLNIIPKLLASSALMLMPVNDPILNPVVPQNACSSCWLDFLQNCLLDATCNSYINCILSQSFQSISTLIQSGKINSTFDLNPTILTCSDPTVPQWGAWRALQNVSHCYAKNQCPVAVQPPPGVPLPPPGSILPMSPNSTNIMWVLPPNRTQQVLYNVSAAPAYPPQFVFNYQLDQSYQSLYGGMGDFASVLPNLVGFPDVTVKGPFNATNTDGSITYSWQVNYPAYAGFLPTYSISDMNGKPLLVLNDAPPSALLSVQPQQFNATAWAAPIFR
ncbi:Aste57867_10315 [Aphanomyces stellatus]|uniref:Aste57867_10315 protein n=1 Tax=Aphanomyces stellatus TaxID=120398 RepID=A0A485KQ14_9STRA|nr:hypothetical protein As57867_010275 [Aphanomyces stellatus]VFT87189.1 Aste57867_10315 [Aphanomyces stellatus]